MEKTVYERLYDIYISNPRIFPLVATHLIDIGFRKAKELTDKEIEDIKGNDFMTDDFCKVLLKTCRDIANIVTSPCELIQFCTAESVFECRYFTNGKHLNYYELEKIASKCMQRLDYNNLLDDDFLDSIYLYDEEDIHNLLTM